jgi:sulfoxide reductase heme-binding subunit YedZ
MAHLAGAPDVENAGSGLPLPVSMLLFASLGVLSTYAALELWSAMASAEQPLLWWAGRALGFVAYFALWLSMLFGSLVSSGGGGGLFSKKWVMDFHQEWTLAAVIATVLHVVVLVTHSESHVTAWAAVIPFASSRLTGEIALGTIALLGLGVIAVSSWLRTRIPYTAWRAIHALSFGVMMLALAHGITAGTDTGTWGASWLYIASTAVLTAVMTMRIGVALTSKRRTAA